MSQSLKKYAEKYGYAMGKPETISTHSFIMEMPNGSLRIYVGLDIVGAMYDNFGKEVWELVAYKKGTISSDG